MSKHRINVVDESTENEAEKPTPLKDGVFIGHTMRKDGYVPTVLYISNGTPSVSFPYDNEESFGRPKAYVNFDLQVLMNRVLQNGERL